MARENNRRDVPMQEEEMPKFGAGSEFGREQREEARRRRYGIAARKYNPDAQPWLMRIGSKKEGKQYKGVREGGVAENAAFYVFTHAPDGSFEAHRVKEWYNFTPIVSYKTLNAEEAEEKYAERGKILNHWAVMVNRKLKPDQEPEDDAEDEFGKGKKKKSGQKSLKISDMDDWVNSGDELDSDEADELKEESEEDDNDNDKKGKRSKDSKKKRSKTLAEKEGIEDSDDGDDEGREVDYMSDASSESEEELLERADEKGVDQDEGLAKMLDSDDSEEEAEKESSDEDENEADGPKKGKKKKTKDGGSKDASDDENAKGGRSGKSSKSNSRANTPPPSTSTSGDGKEAVNTVSDEKQRAEKRKALVSSILDPNAEPTGAKKSRLDPFSLSLPSSSSVSGIEAEFEENVRRYLARKPMTTTEILKKFKNKKTNIPKEELTRLLVNVLKRINPHKQKVKGIMYLSLKTDSRK